MQRKQKILASPSFAKNGHLFGDIILGPLVINCCVSVWFMRRSRHCCQCCQCCQCFARLPKTRRWQTLVVFCGKNISSIKNGSAKTFSTSGVDAINHSGSSHLISKWGQYAARCLWKGIYYFWALVVAHFGWRIASSFGDPRFESFYPLTAACNGKTEIKDRLI